MRRVEREKHTAEGGGGRWLGNRTCGAPCRDRRTWPERRTMRAVLTFRVDSKCRPLGWRSSPAGRRGAPLYPE